MRRRARTIVTVAAAAIALAGCGDLSLVGSLKQEDPGELRFDPPSVALPLNESCQLTALGGITPYSLVSGAVDPLTGSSWQFQAVSSISGEWQDFPVQVRDWAGSTATVVVRVYEGGPVLNATELTLPAGVGWTFTASAGAPPYDWELDGVHQASGSSWAFPGSPEGAYVVDVVDALGATQLALVTVVPSGIDVEPLSATPATAVTQPGGRAVFTALGGDGSYAFSAPDGGALSGANPVTFTAPGATGSYRILLADGAASSASAEVTVTATGTLLLLFPGGASVSALEEQVQFSASGGTPPYSYSSKKPALGVIDQNGLYQQVAEGNVVVTVTDADGSTCNALVKWDP